MTDKPAQVSADELQIARMLLRAFDALAFGPRTIATFECERCRRSTNWYTTRAGLPVQQPACYFCGHTNER